MQTGICFVLFCRVGVLVVAGRANVSATDGRVKTSQFYGS